MRDNGREAPIELPIGGLGAEVFCEDRATDRQRESAKDLERVKRYRSFAMGTDIQNDAWLS